MFTFHRPKIYRSVAGCCICKAKSSSSRFTDSKKYEMEFKDCFNLTEAQKRTGEICNACVLLIKRWKKLPKGTERNWNHVVDARAGPGGKSQLRQKLKTQKGAPSSPYSNNCNNNNNPGALSDHGWNRRHKRRNSEKKKRMHLLDGLRRSHSENDDASPPSPTPSDTSDTSVASHPSSRTGSISSDDLDELPPLLASIIDTSYWKMEKVCCGTIFKGVRGEIMVHPQLLRPCANSCLGSAVKRPAPSSAHSSTPHRSPSNPSTISPALPSKQTATSDLVPTATNKRGARQDSIGSEGSNESSEIEDLTPERSGEGQRSGFTESDVIDDIMDSC